MPNMICNKMKITNSHGQAFNIAHFQGQSEAGYRVIIEHLMSTPIVFPENLCIVTVSNLESESMLIQQLKSNNIDYINIVPQGSLWNNTLKIGYINDSLSMVDSEYVLILDGNDVLINGDITNIINRFKNFNLGALYNATKNDYPQVLIDKIRDRDFRGEFRFFNAGACIGTTEFLRNFYSQAQKIQDSGIENPLMSEQYIIRHAFAKNTDKVDFDYNCQIFQTFARTRIEKRKDYYAVV